MLTAGDRIGDWIVDRPLGEGGMGAVYRVHSALSERVEAALKVMKPSLEADARPRFVREAEALSALRHPAIIRVMGFSEDSRRGLLYLVMELAEGETLKHRLERGPMALPEALATFVPLAAGLEHAHASGISHRDVKPSNVILTPEGVRLVDFGIAAAAQSSDLTGQGHLGTLSYLPPEVFRGEHAEPHSIDIYGLGLLLNEALTGNHPFPVEPGLTPAAAAATVGMRKLQQAALDPGAAFPDAIRDLVRRATDPDPKVRPDMAEMRRVLASLVERRSSGAPAVAGAASAAGAAPATGPVRMPAWTPPADHTMRVPDPVRPYVPGDRSTGVARLLPEAERSVIVAWVASIVAAALLAVLVFVMMRAPGKSAPATDEVSPAPPTTEPSAAPRRRGPAATLPAAVLAASPTPRPSGRPSESPLPSARPSPSPSARPLFPSPVATPRPSPSPTTAPPPPSPLPSIRPTPPPTTIPSPAASPEGAPPNSAADDSNLSGEWLLTNRVDSTDYPAYQGIRLGYILVLRQDGSRISGAGEKTSENGAPTPPAQRSPILVTGRVDNGMVTLQFTERGAQRASSGTFRWQLSPDHARLVGSFASDAASSRGSSTAQRVH